MNENMPEIASIRRLFISAFLAILLALIILVFAVLPAEYGIDPTGVGKKMGLTALAPVQKTPFTVSNDSAVSSDAISITVVDPKRVEAEMASLRAEAEEKHFWNDTVRVVVPAQKGVEYKFYLEKGARLGFEWQTDGAKLYFDFHGEPKGDKTGYFKSFKVATDNRSSGTLKVPFSGVHGWYWKNETQIPVTLLLKTKGDYRIVGLM
jgi:hypothetical protein